ncbi:MAG: hypothetical protein A2847_03085 [Candidatus Sungbacteria bacterium RIFCSPHIGHO2_01_FULL_50_25]|uniref:Uncharacterized protein n=1 Tax=Candidatus Sungbacteria bacterium RIFCSPHIGHO2_01_FULL_50_25 TaxID=1802265 RepID=A0A1G2K9Z9_9BACT|nr:MAG: hypothetical protein A2847_03085 [Candidatus Sungbacteria bacterium RIFCSPHIGHO2_01_FULL_50_25]
MENLTVPSPGEAVPETPSSRRFSLSIIFVAISVLLTVLGGAIFFYFYFSREPDPSEVLRIAVENFEEETNVAAEITGVENEVFREVNQPVRRTQSGMALWKFGVEPDDRSFKFEFHVFISDKEDSGSFLPLEYVRVKGDGYFKDKYRDIWYLEKYSGIRSDQRFLSIDVDPRIIIRALAVKNEPPFSIPSDGGTIEFDFGILDKTKLTGETLEVLAKLFRVYDLQGREVLAKMEVDRKNFTVRKITLSSVYTLDKSFSSEVTFIFRDYGKDFAIAPPREELISPFGDLVSRLFAVMHITNRIGGSKPTAEYLPLYDRWLMNYFGSTAVPDCGDSDRDSMPNYFEFIFETDPRRLDTDGDGMEDIDELSKPVATGRPGDPTGTFPDGSLPQEYVIALMSQIQLSGQVCQLTIP